MADAEHVRRLSEGAEAWNRWRQANPTVSPDLRGGRIDVPRDDGGPTWDLAGCQMAGATVANLANAALAKTPLDNVRFVGLLVNVEFGRCTLRDVDVADTVMQGCNLAGVNARDCAFDNVRFEAAADGRHCSLANSWLMHCSFRDAVFGGTSLSGATLESCDLRGAQGFEFDNTALRRNLLSSGADDDWSTLRRKYTGANMIFNLVLMAVFFGPWALEVLRWSALNQVQRQVVVAASAAERELQRLPPGPVQDAALGQMRALRNPRLEACMERGAMAGRDDGAADCLPVWQVLLGVHEGWRGWLPAGVLLMYNLTRLLLTWVVAPLRDEEDLSGPTPQRKSAAASRWQRVRDARACYGWLLPLHRVVAVAAWVAIAAAVCHVVPRLFSPIWLMSPLN